MLGAALIGRITEGIGDAARYLHVSPDNVQGAEELRHDAADLIEQLHDAVDEVTGRPMYERVVRRCYS